MECTDPADYQPPLRLWSHVWRILVMLLISGLVMADSTNDEAAIGGWFLALDIGLGVAAYVAVHWRRRWPVTIAVTLSLACAVSGVASGPGVLALVSLATRRRGREIAPVASVAFACSQQYNNIVHGLDDLWVNLGANLIGTVAAVGWGLYIGSRRELVWTLRQRAERAEAEQEARVARARITERQRIAREMHDVLAHRISQISMHAGALGFREDLTPEQLHSSAGVIREKAHEALTDLRAVLGVLRDEDGSLADRPQPTYDDLAGLVAEARDSGMSIDLVDQLGGPVPERVGRTAYRIVQEGITNARKHAPNARLTVSLSGGPEDGLRLELHNPLGFGPTSTPGSGLGLIGLAERAALAGGSLEHLIRDGEFVLRAWIPWTR